VNDATPLKKSDLGVRTLSAIVMVAVAGTALWLGGLVWAVFVVLVALGVLWEWVRLAFAFADGPVAQAMWLLAGIVYIGLAALTMLYARSESMGLILGVVLAVIAVDVGAYAFGRTLGGPKIAPSISPSKTWAGLLGGIVGVLSMLVAGSEIFGGIEASSRFWIRMIVVSILTAVLAQVGDFFESWMKRKAGVKDSGALIPGHGGLFDRVDGHLAIFAVLGILLLYEWMQPLPPRPPIVY
jgi:phosphatidate cytidylyltransferase